MGLIEIKDSGDMLGPHIDEIIGTAADQGGLFLEQKLIDTIDNQEPLLRGIWTPKSPATMRSKGYAGKWKLWEKTGELKSVIERRLRSTGNPGEKQVLVGIFDHPKAQIAVYIEYGKGMPERPLFRYVLSQYSEEVENVINDQLEDAIMRYRTHH